MWSVYQDVYLKMEFFTGPFSTTPIFTLKASFLSLYSSVQISILAFGTSLLILEILLPKREVVRKKYHKPMILYQVPSPNSITKW